MLSLFSLRESLSKVYISLRELRAQCWSHLFEVESLLEKQRLILLFLAVFLSITPKLQTDILSSAVLPWNVD